MKIFTSILLACFFLSPAFAEKKFSHQSLLSLTKQVKAKRERLEKKLKASAQLVRFFSSPEVVRQGDSITIYAQNETGFLDQEIMMQGQLDNAPVVLEKPAEELWIFDGGSFSEIRSHEFKSILTMQNKEEASLIKAGIQQLEDEITVINDEIANETDPERIAELEAIRDEKIAVKAELTQALVDLVKPLGEQIYEFFVHQAPANRPGFPKIAAVSPNVGEIGGGTVVTITGENFGSSPVLKVGGVAITPSASSETSITATMPAWATEGPKTVEVRSIMGEAVKNAIRTNGFFVTASDIGGPDPGPQAPIAVVSPPSTIGVGLITTVSALGSSDPDGQPLSYEWRFVAKPQGSSFPIGGLPQSTNASFSFTPDVPGLFLLEARVIETTAPFMQSSAMAIVEAIAPANRQPIVVGGNISVMATLTQTLQVQASDADSWQTLGFYISQQGTLGTATISSSGLVTYVAGATAGSDSVEVLVVDSGVPQSSQRVTIPVTVSTNTNQSPVIGALSRQITTQGLPISASFSTDGISDPDGTIAKLEWNFGDGTVEEIPVSGFGDVVHNYIAAGNYTVVLKATDNLGAFTTRSQSFSIANTDVPTAKFSMSAISGAVPLTINFDASSSSDAGGITSYRWRYGDGSPEENGGGFVTRSHTFNSAGIFKLRFRTRDANSAQGQSEVFVYAGVTPPAVGTAPVASYTIAPNRSNILGTTFNFDGGRSFDPNPSGSLSAYEWNFGDFGTCPNPNGGCSATGLTSGYVYPAATNYFSSLRVTNATGAVSEKQYLEVFAVNAGFAPKPIVKIGPTVGVAPFSVTASAAGSYDYDGTISSQTWTPGDGSPNVSGPAFSHTYTTDGVYFLKLESVDNDNNAPTQATMITVNSSYQALAKSLAAKVKALSDEDAAEREQKRNLLAGACASGAGDACYDLGKMYQEDGDEFTAAKLFEKACGLGFAAACAMGELVRGARW